MSTKHPEHETSHELDYYWAFWLAFIGGMTSIIFGWWLLAVGFVVWFAGYAAIWHWR